VSLPRLQRALAVYSTFSSRFISPAFMRARTRESRAKLDCEIYGSVAMPLDRCSGIVRRPQIGELGKQIVVGPYLVPHHLSVCENSHEGVTGVIG
jgi:hypothetical protein